MLVAAGVAFNILWCWKDVHLHTSEYSLQVKYKGEVTRTIENDILLAPERGGGEAHRHINGHRDEQLKYRIGLGAGLVKI